MNLSTADAIWFLTGHGKTRQEAHEILDMMTAHAITPTSSYLRKYC
ncbi:hypothetical protein ACFO5K_04245 [Nocardia halotolerans]|uniref:Uncharacterized protein n=1 Tax=Nocardia halotolerans TaxID=1755878 RepID=A0ABV8VBK6_9NOCA